MGFGQASFSQKYGHEELPRPLKLGELPKEARNQIWNLFYGYFSLSISHIEYPPANLISRPWAEIFRDVHAHFDSQPLDEWNADFTPFYKKVKWRIQDDSFLKVFDLIEFVLRHPRCPLPFVKGMSRTFRDSRLAYALDIGPPPSIIPAVTPEEGASVVGALRSLRQAGKGGSATHLQEASARINAGDWAGSVRESIHAVESVVRKLDSNSSRPLAPALKSIEQRKGELHPAFKEALIKLYGYTNDEQGIRHALLDQTDAKVGQDEAVFMLGACASFASYLTRKHAGGIKS